MEFESLIFTGLEIPRDYKREREEANVEYVIEMNHITKQF